MYVNNSSSPSQNLITENIPVRLGPLTRCKQWVHDFCSQVWVVKLCRYLGPFRYQRENAEKILRVRETIFVPTINEIVGGDRLETLQKLWEKRKFLSNPPRTLITVSVEDSVVAAFGLKNEGVKSEDVAILNMANRWQLGGVSANPFCRGSQEEALFRSSNLRKSLSSDLLHKQFAEMRTSENLSQDDKPLHHIPYFGAIVSNCVTFLQDSKSECFTVISAAAPDMRPGSDEYDRLQNCAYEEVMRNKIRAIFEGALSLGVKKLVLGASGCGCFANDPKQVATLFKELLDQEYKGRFSKIVFAIKGSQENYVYKIFKQILQSNDGSKNLG